MRRNYYRRCQGRFTRLASLARSLTAPTAAGLLLALATLLVIAPAQGNAQSATYRLTFEGKWTTTATATGVTIPSGAHFSPLIGAVHNDRVTFWSSGGTASAGIESMAEVGGTSTLKTEITAAGSEASSAIERSGNIGVTAIVTVDIALSPTHPLVTLVTMIAPSPDWFVGVSGLSLLNAQNEWLASHSVDLFPYDAGTEDGTEFSLSNDATGPRGTIASIKGMGKFSNEPIANLTFTRQSVEPVITTPSAIDVAENETAVATLSATDQDTASTALTWSIPSGAAGGADATQFTLTGAGVLTFAAAKDFETPDDADGDGTYEVTVQVSDGTHTDTEDIQVTLTDLAPGLTGPGTASHAEGRRGMRVAAYAVVDGDDWSLAGDDSALFTIADGYLRFVDPPDYENAADQGTDNVYDVTIQAADGTGTETTAIAVTVTDIDEPGTVTLSPLRPKLGTALTATLADPDVVSGTTTWQWERNDGREDWAEIAGAMSASYSPTAADGDRYLRVTATYTDSFGAGKTAEAMAPHVVIAHRLSALDVRGLTGVTGDERAFYPVFDPDTLHYAARCTESVTLSLQTENEGARLSVNGVQRPKEEAFTLDGLGRESDIGITLTGTQGASTTYTVHCIDRTEFPKLTTVKADGATEDLMMFRAKWRPSGVSWRSSLIMMDNNGVPRWRKHIGDNVNEYFRVFPDETHPRARYGYMKQGSSYNTDGVELVVLDKYFETVDEDVHILSPFNNTDGHDQIILPNGDYVLMAYSRGQRDLSFLNTAFPDLRNDGGGPLGTNEAVRDSAIQVRTSDGTVKFNWNAWDHMAIEDCIRGSMFNVEYAHINSLGLIDGDIIAGFRYCSKILRIDGDTGDVVWRTGPSVLSREQWKAGETVQLDRGPAPLDFVNDPRGGFSGQHGGHMTSDGNLLVYDNATYCDELPPGVPEGAKGLTQCFERTRAAEYAIDIPNGELVFQREFRMPGTFQGGFGGHAEPLDNGDWVISWSNTFRFGPMPNTAMHVDAETDTPKLTMTLENIIGDRGVGEPHNTRVVMVSPVALATRAEPLEATILSRTEFHSGTADRPRVVVAFNRPVVDFDHTTSSLSLAGAIITSVAPHSEAGAPANAYVLTLIPDGAGDIAVGLMADEPCADGGICAADGAVLSEVPASHVIRADTTPPTVSKIEITSNPGSDLIYAPDDEIQATVTFSEAVLVTETPQLTLKVGGEDRTADYQGGTGTAALIFVYEVADGDDDTDGVSVEADSLSGGTIRDEARNNAVLEHEALSPQASHKVDGVKPVLAGTDGAVADGATLTLTYNELLDGSSTPATGDFTVSGGDRTRTVSRVSVNGSTVLLTLDAGAEHGEAGITVSYTPGSNPIRDVPGNDAEALSRESVRNDTPDTTAPAVTGVEIASYPGFDATYAAGDVIEATVTFDETVEVEGTPGLRLRVGTRTRTAGYDSGTGTAALAFVYEVADGDEDADGVSIDAGRIALNGGTIEDEGENRAELAHEAVAPQAGHKVDGVRPAFVSAAVDGASLTLTYGEALDEGSRPASGDFTVEVGSSERTVDAVDVVGTTVTLTLNPAVEHGDTGIRVGYTPGTNPIRDAVGNEARGLSNRAVTNTTDAPNTAPEITTRGPLSVGENQPVARRLVARDTDPGDEVTGWAIVGGADRFEFSIAPDTGELSFQTPPDYEDPVDVASAVPASGAADNEYVVTVEVRSGAGARELTAEQTFTVSVTDVREPPGVPEAPAFTGETADSLTVIWGEPGNTGPAIADYDVQYRERGAGRFTDAGHEGTGLSLTLDDLEPGTAYEVQVRAANEEGTSGWSASGEGMTVTPLTVGMSLDTEPPVEGAFTVRFSFSEPVTGFTGNDIETGQDPACTDAQNIPVFCDPVIGVLETNDDRIFTTTVTLGTDAVAHNYTLTLTVPDGRVTSVVANKPNEAAALEVRIAPPGVTLPISTIGLRTSAGNGQMTLRWNAPANTGGAAIVRYEYRWRESGGEFGDWMSVARSARAATVRELTNDREYVFEVRGVNALGYGSAETTMATPATVTSPPRPPSTGGGGGGGGGRGRPPSYPGTMRAEGVDGAVTLTWDAPASQGSSRIQYYEYRIDGGGEWISTGSSGRIHTITGLIAGRVYFFHLRAVSAAGAGSHRISPEATPVADLDFTHFANGGFITSTLALVNAGAYPVRPAIYFYDRDGGPIAARRVLELTPDLEVGDDGALRPRTVMNPLGELTIATHGRGGLRAGSVTVRAPGSIGGVLRFDIPGHGVAGVGDSPTLRDALVPVRRRDGGINTGVAVRNRGTATLSLQCRLMRDGAVLEETMIPLAANGQDSRFIDQVFPAADTSDFAGSVRCTAPEPGRFSAVAFELDGVNRIFTTLPVVPVPAVLEQEEEPEQDATRLDFTHFANGGKIVSSLVLVNAGTDPVRPAIYIHDQDGGPIAAESMVDITGDLEVGDDGALRPGTAIGPLGELTISTHGRGVLKVGSVAVTAEGPIGGVLRFDIPGLGVAGVGDSPPVRDALVPVRRQDGGVNTGVALHNRGAAALLVRCRLMRDGAVLEETMIPLAANGQDSRFIDQVFPAADTSDFAGSVRCMTPEPGLFSAVAFELDGVNRIFTTLPVVPVVEVP